MVCPIVNPDAKIIPTTAARMPFIAAFNATDWFTCAMKRESNTIKTAGGVNIPTVAKSAPPTPDTL